MQDTFNHPVYTLKKYDPENPLYWSKPENFKPESWASFYVTFPKLESKCARLENVYVKVIDGLVVDMNNSGNGHLHQVMIPERKHGKSLKPERANPRDSQSIESHINECIQHLTLLKLKLRTLDRN